MLSFITATKDNLLANIQNHFSSVSKSEIQIIYKVYRLALVFDCADRSTASTLSSNIIVYIIT